jgi:hypothetical protein
MEVIAHTGIESMSVTWSSGRPRVKSRHTIDVDLVT